MIRRLGLVSLTVVVFAFAGTSAGAARPLQSRQIVVFIAWLNASEQIEREPQAGRQGRALQRQDESRGTPYSRVAGCD